MSVNLKIACSQTETGKYAILPKQNHPGDAVDLYIASQNGVIIYPHEHKLYDTGLCIEMPDNCYGIVALRSNMGKNTKLRHTTGFGLIDPSYRGSIFLNLENTGGETIEIPVDKPICQLFLIPRIDFNMIPCEYEELSVTERGTGGFGSTDQTNKTTVKRLCDAVKEFKEKIKTDVKKSNKGKKL